MARFNISRLTRIETSRKNIALLATLTLLLVLSYAVHAYFGGHGIPASGPNYYSIDDGRTFFGSNSIRIPPFSYNGKKAVAAGVFIDAHGAPFVAYVYKYDETGRGMVASGISTVGGQRVDNGAARQQAAQFCYVSKPGGKQWVPWNSPAGKKIINVRNPATGQPFKSYDGW